MREGGRRQPGKPPLPEQMLSAISPVAFTKEEKCGVLQGLKLSVLPSPAPWVCVCLGAGQGLAPRPEQPGWEGKEINVPHPPSWPACARAGWCSVSQALCGFFSISPNYKI